MTNDEILGRFRIARRRAPDAPSEASHNLANYVSDHYAALSASDVAMFMDLGERLERQVVEDLWSGLTLEAVAPKTEVLPADPSFRSVHVTDPLPTRQLVHLFDIQTMVFDRQQQHADCTGLTFDSAYRKAPEGDGCNWDIEQVPARDNAQSQLPYNCFCVMESYIYELQAGFNISDVEDPSIVV